MAAYFLDLDGTCFTYHTCDWLPGIPERLEALAAEGHRIYFITMRDLFRDAYTPYSLEHTRTALRTLSFHGWQLLTNVPSPRTLVDDTPPRAIAVTTNDPTNASKF